MVKDLAEIHGLLGDTFTRPADEESWNKLRLSDEQVAHYHEHGYVAGVRLLNDAQVDRLREELARLFDPRHPGHHLFYEFHTNESTNAATVLFHALGAWRIEEAFHDILWNPAFLVPAAQLIGGPIRFWHDQLFSKPARDGGVVAWHQDYSYWTRTVPVAHLTCWIGLDDSTKENGCVHYVPGSHRWNLLPITGLAGDMEAIQSVLTVEQRKRFQPIPVEMKRGEASFHHPLLVHGSLENRSARSRRAAVINAFIDGVGSRSNEPLLTGVPPIPKGEKMGGRFFPLLLDPGKI